MEIQNFVEIKEVVFQEKNFQGIIDLNFFFWLMVSYCCSGMFVFYSFDKRQDESFERRGIYRNSVICFICILDKKDWIKKKDFFLYIES